jgi:hypothetical protein
VIRFMAKRPMTRIRATASSSGNAPKERRRQNKGQHAVYGGAYLGASVGLDLPQSAQFQAFRR